MRGGYRGRLHYGHFGVSRYRPALRRSRSFGRHRRWGWLHRGLPAPGLMSSPPSPMVAWAQGCLVQLQLLGPWVPQDGIMGPDTRQAILQFQTQQQLGSTGVLDDNTVGQLQAACSDPQLAQQGASAAAAPFSMPPSPQPLAGQPPGTQPGAASPPAGGRQDHQHNRSAGEVSESENDLAAAEWRSERDRRSGRWVYDQKGRIVVLGV